MEPSKTLLLIGRRGRGKSSLANLLVKGERWESDFIVSHFQNSAPAMVTKKRSLISGHFIVDTTGYDPSISADFAINEINEILSYEGIGGVLFVISAGRQDDWDGAVFKLYLQLILAKVPASMVGVVFTRSNQDCVKKNSLKYYLDQPGAINSVLMDLLLQRCSDKVCFIDNPDPSKDEVQSMDGLRTLSLRNVQELISQLEGYYSFHTFWDHFKLSVISFLAESDNAKVYFGVAAALVISVVAAFIRPLNLNIHFPSQ